jgi:flagellin
MMVINAKTEVSKDTGLLGRARENLNKSLARLTSVSTTARSAAGAASGPKPFQAEIARAKEASAHIENALSYSRTQDQFLVDVQSALERLSEISVDAQTLGHGSVDLSKYSTEFCRLQDYISDITSKTFNGVDLFGAQGLALRFQDDTPGVPIAGINLSGPTAEGVLNAYSGTSVSSRTAAFEALNNLKTAIQALASMRARVGANLQRLSLSNHQLNILAENLNAVSAREPDTSAARETVSRTTANILAQTGDSMVANAKLAPDSALRL